MAPQLRALDALPKDPGSVPSTHVASKSTRHACDTHTGKYTHKMKISKFWTQRWPRG